MKKLFAFFVCAFCGLMSFAQENEAKYRAIDASVTALGAMQSVNVAIIADTLTRPFAENEDKARAIFYWIATNIAIDPKGTKQNDPKNNVPERVIELRTATPLGFSLLVQEMCSAANIRCISVDGFIKRSASDINEGTDEINHSWNVIQLGKSPETWYFADACRASGFLDKKMTMFTKQYSPGFFFADRKLFNLASFPDNRSWQLGGGPKSIKEFYSLPVISNEAFAISLDKPTPALGFVKASLQKGSAFSFNAGKEIKEITVITGDEKKMSKPEKVEFENSGGLISFVYKFKKEESYPFRILADGKEVLQYMVEVSE